MSNGLPFERSRNNPVQDVTPDEAERNKRLMGKNEAAQRDHDGRDEETPRPDPDKATS